MLINLKIDNVVNSQVSSVELVKQFNNIMRQANEIADNDILLEKANQIALQIIDVTLQTYERTRDIYKVVRGNKLKEIDVICWSTLIKYIDKYISSNKHNVDILDVGTGNGRDLIHGQSLGYNVIGVDNCNGFIELLAQHQEDGLIKANCYKKCDMRALDFPDCSFDVVRHNASLLHLPLIGKKYTVDLALNEAFRVLKPKGLLYIFVKTGATLEIHDTKENLGGRIFQFFSHKTLNDVVTRNGFTIVYTSDEVELRENNTIDWILLIAQKEID